MTRLRRHLTLLAGALLAAIAYQTPAASEELTIGYQTAVEPSKLAQADGSYDKATGWTINWRKFDSGADVIAAVASGDIQIGYVGSSPLASAASRELPIQTIYIVGLIGDAEALVVRNGSGIAQPEDLVSKKVAVPFVSTTHYSLLAALKHWSIDPKQVQILNLKPPEIVAAWERGDIDAAYVWDPALGKAKETGTVLVTSAEVAKWGAPTFDAWIARTDFSSAHADVVTNFVKVTAETYKTYAEKGGGWTTKSPEVQAIAKLTGAKVEEVPALLKAYQFPTLAEQRDLLSGPIVKSVAETSTFLAEQGKIPAVLPDYAPYVTAKYVADVLAAK